MGNLLQYYCANRSRKNVSLPNVIENKWNEEANMFCRIVPVILSEQEFFFIKYFQLLQNNLRHSKFGFVCKAIAIKNRKTLI